jgi:argininosuccinate lyase
MLLLLPAVTGSLESLTFDTRRMGAAVTSTMMATDLADHLVRKRVTFRAAHAAVGKLVREAETRGVGLEQLPLGVYRSAHSAFGADIFDELSPATSVAHRELPGGTGQQAVRRQLSMAAKLIKGT